MFIFPKAPREPETPYGRAAAAWTGRGPRGMTAQQRAYFFVDRPAAPKPHQPISDSPNDSQPRTASPTANLKCH